MYVKLRDKMESNNILSFLHGIPLILGMCNKTKKKFKKKILLLIHNRGLKLKLRVLCRNLLKKIIEITFAALFKVVEKV